MFLIKTSLVSAWWILFVRRKRKECLVLNIFQWYFGTTNILLIILTIYWMSNRMRSVHAFKKDFLNFWNTYHKLLKLFRVDTLESLGKKMHYVFWHILYLVKWIKRCIFLSTRKSVSKAFAPWFFQKPMLIYVIR